MSDPSYRLSGRGLTDYLDLGYTVSAGDWQEKPYLEVCQPTSTLTRELHMTRITDLISIAESYDSDKLNDIFYTMRLKEILISKYDNFKYYIQTECNPYFCLSTDDLADMEGEDLERFSRYSKDL